MIKDGLMERYQIQEVYGMHNMPGLPAGNFGIRPGSIMATSDQFSIRITGRGGHAAAPHLGVDPVVAAAHIIVALQSLISREIDPLKSIVISVTTLRGGDADNIIPDEVTLSGTIRTHAKDVRDYAVRRFRELVTATASAHQAGAEISMKQGYPIVWNHPAQTVLATKVATSVVGADRVDDNVPPKMAGEDFSYMLESRPGAFIFLGNGDTPDLHNPAYDFNDEVLPVGMAYWVALAQSALSG
jgi:hippurate hydrolase